MNNCTIIKEVQNEEYSLKLYKDSSNRRLPYRLNFRDTLARENIATVFYPTRSMAYAEFELYKKHNF